MIRRRFPLRPRDWAILCAVAGMVGLIALAAALRGFEFSPPQPIGRESGVPLQSEFEQILREIREIPVWKSILAWVLFLTIIGLVSALLSRELRRRLVRILIRTASFVFIFLYVIKLNPDLVNLLNPLAGSGAGDAFSGSTTDIPVPVFQPPQFAPGLVFLASFLILTLVLVGLWFMNRWWITRHTTSKSLVSLKDFASIARTSAAELESGADWGDAILRCYERMNRVVGKNRGLLRERSMTPAEFAIRLEQAGLPREPVNRLTRLFEFERYSPRSASQLEITEAVACLHDISRACGDVI